MTRVYPVILTPTPEGYVCTMPDWDSGTQGKDLAEAVSMARDAMGLLGLCLEDEGKPFPEPATLAPAHVEGELVTLVDVDFAAARRASSNRSVRRNVSLPSWLNDAADKAGLNCSAIFQDALKAALGLN